MPVQAGTETSGPSQAQDDSFITGLTSLFGRMTACKIAEMPGGRLTAAHHRLATFLALLLLALTGCGPAGSLLNAPQAAGPSVSSVPTNSEAELFVEPEDGPDPVVNELNAATRSVDVVVYLLTDKQVISALEAAQRRGVQVRVMLEQHPYGEGPGNGAVYDQLQRAGIATRWANPRFKLTHEKAMVIDGREALILTLNLTASAFTHNREYGVIDRTLADVAETEALFNADWNRTGYSPVQPNLVTSPDNSRGRLMALLNQATKQLDVESEEIQDPGLEDAITAAAQRGVQVRLVISPPASGPDTNAQGVSRLKSGGVQVRYLRKPYIHAKIFAVDGSVAFVGSENVSSQSLDGNRELGIFLSQPAALARLAQTFEQDWTARG